MTDTKTEREVFWSFEKNGKEFVMYACMLKDVMDLNTRKVKSLSEILSNVLTINGESVSADELESKGYKHV